MITIVDYGVGNLASIQNILKKIGQASRISSEAEEIISASKLILPGVGAFDTCAGKLQASGLLHTLTEEVLNKKKPVLGVCVGLQLLMEGSEEGQLPGLGWIKGKVVKFKIPDQRLRIPHMGWGELELNKPSVLLKDMPEEMRFYFVHSYHVVPDNQTDVAAFGNYGYRFAAAVEHENILGVQFHPEKSHKFGMKLLENFSNT